MIKNNVKAISMYDKDGDIIFEEVEEKLNKKGYEMINRTGFKFADRDIFALSKIILESRAFQIKRWIE